VLQKRAAFGVRRLVAAFAFGCASFDEVRRSNAKRRELAALQMLRSRKRQLETALDLSFTLSDQMILLKWRKTN